MPLTAPIIDDRKYEDIVTEARSLIPRYAPEWTNLNDSDPGITLVQLFAWMTDMLIYRLNKVPDLNYIKFLQLLGIELNPAQAARAELTFTLVDNPPSEVIVPAGTEVAVANAKPPIIFETQESLIAIGAAIASVQVFDGYAYSDVTANNRPGAPWFYPFGPRAQQGSALLLGFDSTVPFTKEQLNLAVEVHLDPSAAVGLTCSAGGLDVAASPLPAMVQWEFFASGDWLPFSIDADGSRALTQSGHVYLSGQSDMMTRSQPALPVGKDLYWIRCKLAASTYESAPRLDQVLTNTIAATNAQTVRDEVLGNTTGEPNQRFHLANRPVVPLANPLLVPGAGNRRVQLQNLWLEIDEGDGNGFQVWREVSDFYGSGPRDADYTLDQTTADILFGDGSHGRIPVANLSPSGGNVVARIYRHGGSATGNVGPGSIKDIQAYIPGVQSAVNLRLAQGGADEESVADAKLRAAEALKNKQRAVTGEDFEALARTTPGALVQRAKALPLTHPRFPGVAIPGVVTVIVVPLSDRPNPLPNQATLSLVCDWLDKHRLLTCEVHVVPPQYRLVKVQTRIIAKPEADLGQVKKAVGQALTDYFHPLTGGEAGTGWEFGGTIYYSQVYRRVLEVDGVSRIQDNQLSIYLDGVPQVECQDVPINADHLTYSIGHDLQVDYGARP